MDITSVFLNTIKQRLCHRRYLKQDVRINVTVFLMHHADVSVNSAGNTIARTIFNKE